MLGILTQMFHMFERQSGEKELFWFLKEELGEEEGVGVASLASQNTSYNLKVIEPSPEPSPTVLGHRGKNV